MLMAKLSNTSGQTLSKKSNSGRVTGENAVVLDIQTEKDTFHNRAL